MKSFIKVVCFTTVITRFELRFQVIHFTSIAPAPALLQCNYLQLFSVNNIYSGNSIQKKTTTCNFRVYPETLDALPYILITTTAE